MRKKKSGGGKKKGRADAPRGLGGRIPRKSPAIPNGSLTILQQLEAIKAKGSQVSVLTKIVTRPDAPCLCQRCGGCGEADGGPRRAGRCADFGGFCGMPLDVALLLFSSYMSAPTFVALGLVNSRWGTMVATEEVWRPLTLARWPELGFLGETGVRDWLVVHRIWRSGTAADILRLSAHCPLMAVPPTKNELRSFHVQFKLWRGLNSCPYGGIPTFERRYLTDARFFHHGVVMEAAFERSRAEIFKRFRCKIYTHDLFIAITPDELERVERHGWFVVKPHAARRGADGTDGAPLDDDAPAALPGDAVDLDARDWLADFRVRMAAKREGLVANMKTSDPYAFWYNPARAIEHREVRAPPWCSIAPIAPCRAPRAARASPRLTRLGLPPPARFPLARAQPGATLLLCVNVLVPEKLPHSKVSDDDETRAEDGARAVARARLA